MRGARRKARPSDGECAHQRARIDAWKVSNFLTSAAVTDLRALLKASSKWAEVMMVQRWSSGAPALASAMCCRMASLHAGTAR